MDNPQEPEKFIKKKLNKKRWKPWERTKEWRDMKKFIALLNAPTAKAAYMALNPNASEATAESAGSKLLTPEMLEKLREMISIDPKIKTTRVTIERFIFHLLSQYMAGKIRPTDAIRSLELLSKLIPDFKTNVAVEDLTNLSKEEINKRLLDLGHYYPTPNDGVSRN